MAAPDLPILHQFEKQIEPAAVTVLTPPLTGVLIVPERSAVNLGTGPRIEVKLQMGAPTGKKRPLPGAVVSTQTLDEAYFFQLVLTVVTNRKTPGSGDRHDELLGQLRVCALVALGGLNAQLAWLLIQELSSVGVIPVARGESDLDMSPCVFSGRFLIRPDAWPVLPAAV